MIRVRFERGVRHCLRRIEAAGAIAAPPALRLALALPFFRSGLTRWDGFPVLSAGTLYLFEERFSLHLPGGAYPLPVPDLLAYATAVAEIILPVLLFLGLATRCVALGLLAMTAVIEDVFPAGWENFHLYWAALALAIMARGAGPFSLDRLIEGRVKAR